MSLPYPAPHPTRVRDRRASPLGILVLLFALLSLLVALVWSFGIGEAEVYSATHRLLRFPARETDASPAGLQAGLLHALRWLDFSWITLGAACVYMATIAQEGLSAARRWAACALLAGLLLSAASASTGWPLGPVRYTDLLGSKIGPVPFCVGLLWVVVLLGSRELAGRLAPRASHVATALFTGGLVLLFDLSLEPIAWRERVFWQWYPGRLPLPGWPPLQNFFTWWTAGTAGAFLMRQRQVAQRPLPFRHSAACIFCTVVAVVELALLGRMLRT